MRDRDFELSIGSAQWMLSISPDDSWEVARKGGAGLIWDTVAVGERGAAGLLEVAEGWMRAAILDNSTEAIIAVVDVLRCLAGLAGAKS